MKNRIFQATLLTACLVATSSVSAQPIGKTIETKRIVYANGKVLRTGSDIFANQRIRANSSGLGHFKFNDGTKMVVGPGTRLVLDETIYRPGGSKFTKFAIDSSRGALRFISGSSAPSSYEIQTPTGTLGIRGTAFDLRHYRGRTYIMLVNGRVNFCTNSGNCETISRKCDYVVAQPNGRINPPSQPRSGIFGKTDMERYFPFINDQSNIQRGFRLNVNVCTGGNAAATGNGPDSNSGDGNFGAGNPGVGIGPGTGSDCMTIDPKLLKELGLDPQKLISRDVYAVAASGRGEC